MACVGVWGVGWGDREYFLVPTHVSMQEDAHRISKIDYVHVFLNIKLRWQSDICIASTV